MLRAPFLALLALLAGAALTCSESVPPPGATLSGFVYYDANANGIMDSCDEVGAFRPYVTVRIDPEGAHSESYQARVADGKWSVSNVSPGNYNVGLAKPAAAVSWITTVPPERGGPSYDLSVKGYETVRNLGFGITGDRAVRFGTGTHATYLLIFDDLDADGQVDANECPAWEIADQGKRMIPGAFQSWDNSRSPPEARSRTPMAERYAIVGADKTGHFRRLLPEGACDPDMESLLARYIRGCGSGIGR